MMATATTELQAAMGRDASLASAVYSLFARKLTHQLASQNSFVHRWRDTSAEPLRKALVVFAHLEGLAASWILLLDHPVEHEIVLVSHSVEQILEEFAKVSNIGLLLKF